MKNFKISSYYLDSCSSKIEKTYLYLSNDLKRLFAHFNRYCIPFNNDKAI